MMSGVLLGHLAVELILFDFSSIQIELAQRHATEKVKSLRSARVHMINMPDPNEIHLGTVRVEQRETKVYSREHLHGDVLTSAIMGIVSLIFAPIFVLTGLNIIALPESPVGAGDMMQIVCILFLCAFGVYCIRHAISTRRFERAVAADLSAAGTDPAALDRLKQQYRDQHDLILDV